MKVLQINSVIDYGSTGRITRNLYDYLENNGHECVIAFGRGNATPGYNTIKIGSKFDQFFHGIYSRLSDRHGFGSKLATKELINKIDDYNPDIIQLHNLHGYYVNIKVLFNYLSKKNIPVVWLLHDQWTISGHSANFNLNSDGSLPEKLINRQELVNYPRTVGISQFERNFKDKEELFTSLRNMTIVTPSHWLTNIIGKSFLNKYPLITVHNGVDTNVFRVDNTNSSQIRRKWNAEDKKVLLGVASVWDERKGLTDFVKLSKALSNDEYQIVLVGLDESTKEILPDEIISITRTNHVDELRDIYNASDLFVNPTYFDNFPTVNIEALACGTPVVTYETGGSPESIDIYTGEVTEQGNIEGLVEIIKEWPKKNKSIINQCRRRVNKKYTKEKTYFKYLELYENILGAYMEDENSR